MSKPFSRFNDSALKVAYYDGALNALKGVVEAKFNHDDPEFIKFVELTKIELEKAKLNLEKGPLLHKVRRRK